MYKQILVVAALLSVLALGGCVSTNGEPPEITILKTVEDSVTLQSYTSGIYYEAEYYCWDALNHEFDVGSYVVCIPMETKITNIDCDTILASGGRLYTMVIDCKCYELSSEIYGLTHECPP